MLIAVSRVLSKLAEKGKSRFFKDTCKARATGGGLEGSETQIVIPGGITSIRFPFASVISTSGSQPRLALMVCFAFTLVMLFIVLIKFIQERVAGYFNFNQ